MHPCPYPTDLTDQEWNEIKSLVPAPKAKPGRRGRPPKRDRRCILNAILYVVRSGCAWRLLPKDFGPWSTIYGYFRRWSQDWTWKFIHDRLRDGLRKASGRRAAPTAAILDSQSVKTAEQGGACGYDAGKNIKGRKRHLAVDSLGLLLGVLVTSASVSDPRGAQRLLSAVVSTFGWLQIIWADRGYQGRLVAWVKSLRPWGKLRLDIVKPPQGRKGFHVQRKRWIVGRTLSWFFKSRRLRNDYEVRTDHSEAMILLCMIRIMVKRLASR